MILDEHRTIRDLLAVAPDSRGLDRLEGLLRSHFQKEEELLFPFAEAHLTPEELGSIGGAE